ncbi:MAG: hypothetical protein ACQEVA_00195 [Myxococcota bacterium]
MSDQNDGNKPDGPQQGGPQQGGPQQGGGDWGNNDGWGDQSKPQPTGEPSSQQTPGPQGAQQPAGGEWSGGHANNPNPPTSTADQQNEGWGQGQAQPNANLNNPQGGQMQQQPPSQAPQSGSDLNNNDIIAIILAFFLPGVGQMMLGQKTKGIVLLGVYIVTCFGLGLLPWASVIDAYLAAKTAKYRALDEWEFFPDMNQHF